jgi:hypothetical protein
MRLFAINVLLLLLIPLQSYATEFPFQIRRGANGKIEQIILPKKGMIEAVSGPEMINDVKEAYMEYVDAGGMRLQTVAEQLEVPQEHREDLKISNMALVNDLKPQDFDDPKLIAEFEKAQREIQKAPYFRLLADPDHPQAFDEEKALQLTIDVIFKAAHQVLIVNPLFNVFEFLVNEYLEAMMSRREFYQNQLVYLVNQDTQVFSSDDKKRILSSIFYSRISLLRPDKRAKAVKKWDTFGIDTYKKEVVDKCDGFVGEGEVSFGNCFKIKDHKIRNRLAKKSLLNKKPSIAFNYEHNHSVRNYRALVLLIKLGSKIAPIPSPGGSAFRAYLSSLYKNQRRTEGYLFAYLMDHGDVNLSRWVLVSSANPLINK